MNEKIVIIVENTIGIFYKIIRISIRFMNTHFYVIGKW